MKFLLELMIDLASFKNVEFYYALPPFYLLKFKLIENPKQIIIFLVLIFLRAEQ